MLNLDLTRTLYSLRDALNDNEFLRKYGTNPL